MAEMTKLTRAKNLLIDYMKDSSNGAVNCDRIERIDNEDFFRGYISCLFLNGGIGHIEYSFVMDILLHREINGNN